MANVSENLTEDTKTEEVMVNLEKTTYNDQNFWKPVQMFNVEDILSEFK
jgi:hypothetical protein